VIEALVFSDVPDKAILCKQNARMTAPLKELRRRDCARRQWRPYRGRTL
jgi:hypothetical protein